MLAGVHGDESQRLTHNWFRLWCGWWNWGVLYDVRLRRVRVVLGTSDSAPQVRVRDHALAAKAGERDGSERETDALSNSTEVASEQVRGYGDRDGQQRAERDSVNKHYLL